MDRRPTCARHLAALSLLLASTAISPVLAASFTVNAGTDTTAKSVTGTDTDTVTVGASLSTSGTATTWTGSSKPPGVVIDNSGTISSSTSRGIFDEDNAYLQGRNYFLENGGRLIATPEPVTLVFFVPVLFYLLRTRFRCRRGSSCVTVTPAAVAARQRTA